VKQVLLLGALLAGCGGSSSCPDDPTACRGHVQLRWSIMTAELEGFAFNETCMPVGADLVELELEGPKPDTETFSCQDGQTILIGLPPGEYSVRGTLLQEDRMTGDRTAVTNGETTTTFRFEEEDTTVDLDFPYGHFLNSYMGSYYFKTSWAGMRACAQASPPVKDIKVRIERDGQPVTGVTGDGMPLDGSAAGSCRDFVESPYFANDLMWGPATITITGMDATGMEQFRDSYPTFVGAGRSNPEFQFDVRSLGLTPDAGVAPDAP